MKAQKLLTGIFILLPVLLFSQDEYKYIQRYPFAKGIGGWPLEKFVDYCYTTDYDDNGDKLGHSSQFDLDIDKTYFFMRGLGASLDYCYNYDDESNYNSMSSRFLLGLVYGNRLTPKLDFYVGAGFIYDADKTKSGNTTDKEHGTGFYGELGVLFPINGTNTYFVPELNYRRTVTDFDDGKETYSGFGLNMGMRSYMDCDDYWCDHRHGYSLSRGKYEPGNFNVNYQSMAGFSIGMNKIDYDQIPTSSETDFNRFHLSFDGDYYVAHHLAVGLNLRLGSSKQEGQNNSFTSTRTSFGAGGYLQYNLPFEKGLDNWFVKAGIGYGTSKNETKIPTGTSTLQLNRLRYSFTTGYDLYITNRLFVTPEIGYKISTETNPDTDVKTRSRGIDFEAGSSINFRF